VWILLIFFLQKYVTEAWNFCLILIVSYFVTISEHSSIINNVLNPCASSLNHSCYAHIEVCDNTVTHIQWNPPNFLTNVCLQSLYCLRIVSLLGGFLPGKSLLNCRWVRTTYRFRCKIYLHNLSPLLHSVSSCWIHWCFGMKI
jgi:hypothetical protein